MRLRLLTAIIMLFISSSVAVAQTTALTYQGKLSDNGAAANGNYDIQFKLFDTAAVGTGSQQGPTVTNSTVVVSAGAFTVQLDFGSGAFNGLPRFIEIGVCPAGNANPYNVLTPRQPVTSTPYAVRSLNSSVADVLSSACVGCVTSTQVGGIAGSVVSGTIPVASVPAGSSNYLQNTTGQAIAFFGSGAGGSNTTGGSNSFIGNNAGKANTTGLQNSFFGRDAGQANSTGANNTFLGYQSGNTNTNTSGVFNVFLGTFAGNTNTTGDNNTVIGYNADVGSNNLTFATAIGAGAVVLSSNHITLGRLNGSDKVEVRGPLDVEGASLLNSGVVVGNGDATFGGHVVINAIASVGNTSVCLNAANQIALCSSSLRYKESVQPFSGGLDVVRRLRPITFNWKQGGIHDVGFGAEEVEKIEPLLTIRNNKGEIEGVKYGQITTVLVNAVKEQNAHIEKQDAQIQTQKEQIKRQQAVIEGLRKLVCQNHSQAEVCQ